MKFTFFKISTITLAFLAILGNTACNNATTPVASNNNNSTNNGGSKIAYINVDTLQEKYVFWKNEIEALEADQAKVESELQRSSQQLQNDAAAFQQKAQSGGYSEAEGRAAQQRLAQMQQSLETRQKTLSEQLQKRQADFSKQLQKNIDEYLAIYNKDNKYDYILSYTKVGQVLYANKALDITEDVLKGLNAQKSNAVDTTTTK